MPQAEFGPLQEASIDDLWAEIASRHTAAVFTAIRRCEKDAGAEECILLYGGGVASCLGLSVRATRRLEDICVEPAEDGDDRDW